MTKTGSPSFWKPILKVFLIPLVDKRRFQLDEHRRRERGPWEMTFTEVAGVPAIIDNQPALRLANITVVFNGVPPQSIRPQTVAFEHGHPALFELPFGKCIFVDANFLPDTATCEIFNREIQLLPRTLRINRVEQPWHAVEKIFLPGRPPVTLPPK